ncbi:MAG TPA: helix-turn-helix domain-containing protein [Streptosporangiaceae bacterium]
MTTARLRDAAAPPRDIRADGAEDGVSFRERLTQGLATSIRERGFRDTTIADIVRHARTSRRTFYAEFASKEECYVALLAAMNEALRVQIATAVDPQGGWELQVRQAVVAYVDNVASEPALSVSWIRELPALGTIGRQVQRRAMEALSDLLLQLDSNEGFRRAGTVPMTRPLAIILLGGIRELSAAILEDSGDIHDLTEVAIQAATALLRPPPEPRAQALAPRGPRG